MGDWQGLEEAARTSFSKWCPERGGQGRVALTLAHGPAYACVREPRRRAHATPRLAAVQMSGPAAHAASPLLSLRDDPAGETVLALPARTLQSNSRCMASGRQAEGG